MLEHSFPAYPQPTLLKKNLIIIFSSFFAAVLGPQQNWKEGTEVSCIIPCPGDC